MKLHRVGFFRELEYGDPLGPSLRDAVRSSVTYDKKALMKYLSSAAWFAWAPGLAGDVLNPSASFSDPYAILTDGVWVWPESLAYYVETYNVELPYEFLEHVKRMAFIPPDKKDIDIRALEF